MTIDEKAAVVEKVRKIKAMAEGKGTTEAEAQAFAAKMQEMMLRYQLSMSDVEYEKVREEEGVEIRFYPHSANTNVPKWAQQKDMKEWARMLAGIIAKANQCKVLFYSDKGSTKCVFLSFLGRETNATVCFETMMYLFPAACHIAARAYDREYNRCYFATPRQDTSWMKGYKTSFLFGFVQRMGERFDENQKALEGESNSTALVRLSDAIVVAQRALSKIKLGKPKMLSSQRNDSHNTEGYRAGRKKADELNIGGKALGK